MQLLSQIIKILFMGVLLHGVALLAEDVVYDSHYTPLSESQLCRDFKELTKTNSSLQLNSFQEVKEFYNDYCKRSDTLAWSDASFRLSNQAIDLMQSVQDSYDQGLNPNKYHLSAFLMHIQTMNSDANQSTKQESLNRIDVLLSDAYITLAKDLYYGVTDWKKFKESKKEQNKKLFKNQDIPESSKEDIIEWDRAKKNSIHLSSYLEINLAANKISDSLNILSPDSQEYRRLMASLKYYRMLLGSGGWEKIPSGETIKIGQSDERLVLIKKRLYITGDLDKIENNESTLYNETKLIDAVKSFQAAHNLTQDGLIGQKTMNALNISASAKVGKIILNMERFRWLNQGMDNYEAYININIPAFLMQVLEYGNEVIGMKVIVGKKERPTPVLNSKISYAVLKPSWTAPKTIVKEDILEKGNLQEYLQSHNMRVYMNLDGEMFEVNADEIDWSLYAEAEYIPYIFKADSGEANPLGEVKFIFNNKYSVYMHDTNQPYLFQNEYRALSSGCLRLNEPMRLLAYLLDTKDAIIAEQKGADQIVNLKKKIPVVIRYMTVSVDKNNRIYFYDDIYGYDTLQKESLKANSWML
jgi:murein L,D-transpeptidase YcbB/YkuD